MNARFEQYKAIKAKYPDAALLFRVGDFYEAFEDDANVVSQCLGLTLAKSTGDEWNAMAGFPFHSLDGHLRTLVKAGYKVAICEQLEDPKNAKGTVRRAVTDNAESLPPKCETQKIAALTGGGFIKKSIGRNRGLSLDHCTHFGLPLHRRQGTTA